MPGMNRGDNIEEIYAWIDDLQFSKPKKNISRDFSDGVLMAEVLKIHYPRFSDVHNYIPANNVAGKRENWNTLNRKVFSKIDMKLSKEVINQLANAQPGIIENVLIDLRSRILTEESFSAKNQSHDNLINDQDKTDDSTRDEIEILPKDDKTSSSEALNSAVVKTSNSHIPMTKNSKNFIAKACSWLVSWMWPFNGSEKTLAKESSSSLISASLETLEKRPSNAEQKLTKNIIENEDEEAPEISRLDFLQLKQEVREKNFTINMLNRKVSRLESAMKLKDQKIGNLSSRISSLSTETAQNLRPHVMGSNISRLQYQTKNYNNKSISQEKAIDKN